MNCWQQGAYAQGDYIFPRYCLCKPTRIIHHNQLSLTKFGKNFVILNRWRQNVCHIEPMTSKVQLAAGYWTVDREKSWGPSCVGFGEQRNKERNGETLLRTGKRYPTSYSASFNNCLISRMSFVRIWLTHKNFGESVFEDRNVECSNDVPNRENRSCSKRDEEIRHQYTGNQGM